MNELELEIQKLRFAAVELNLYLDNFPNDRDAKDNYRRISNRLDKLVCEYEKCYGPMSNFGNAYIENPCKWTSEPWPWENC